MCVCVVWVACIGGWGVLVVMPQAGPSDSRALCHVYVSVNKMDWWRSEMEIMPEAARVLRETLCV